MTIGGSWIFCCDDNTGANAELIVTRDSEEGDKMEKFWGGAAISRLKKLVRLQNKVCNLCGYYEECYHCPVSAHIKPSECCAHWVETHIDNFLDIYEEWGKTHGSNYKGTNMEKHAEEVSTEAKVD